MVTKAPLAKCDECPLREEPHVNGRGPDLASLVVVGEAPGQQETQSGIPFTGRSGQLLDGIFKHQGINRDEVYVTNTTLCRPPGNETPPKEAILACRDRLVDEVSRRQPKTVLLLGNTAAQTLLDTRTGITALRTTPDLESPYLEGRMVPTFHPAAALRNGDFLPSILRDVGKINAGKITWEHTKYKVPETLTEGLQLLRQQNEYGLTDKLVLDVETDFDAKYPTRHSEVILIGISHREGATVVYPKEIIDHPEFKATLNRLFENGPKRWGYQNGKFDIQELWRHGVPNARVDEDTMLMHYCTDERKGTHDLEQLAVEVLGAPRYKTDARQYLPYKGASLAYLPPDVLHQYNAADCDVTHRLFAPLEKEMRSDGTEQPYRELLVPGSDGLARAEYMGVRVDDERIDLLDDELSRDLESREAVLSQWVGNPRSPKQVRESFEELGILTDTTNKEFLKGVIEKSERLGIDEGYVRSAEFARQLLSYRAAAKLLSTYVRGLRKRVIEGRVHPTFLLHGTETGRLSCRKPNLQNQPSGAKIRDIYIAEEDHVLLSADYSQIEFRLAGVFSEDPWLLEQFRAGRDFHSEVARRFYGDTWSELQYLRAKAVNFGILYGRQAPSLATEWKMPMPEAQALINGFFKNMPKVKEYQKGIERQIRERGYLESYFGRKRRFWLVTRDNWHFVTKEGYNFPLQSTASDLTLKALIRLEPILRGKATPVITVHDSIVLETRRDYLPEVIHTVKEVMEDSDVSSICPTPVEIKVGRKWGSHKKECPDPICEHLQLVEA